MKISITNHALVRCGQRGFRENDFDLVFRFGTLTDDGYHLTRKDIMEVDRQVRKLVDRLTKLQDAFVPTTADGSAAKTIFRETKMQRRRRTGRR
ncbi:MAG: hypothetical protein OXC26_03125 [Albidovulum sp.]|nr:hypothetical protein [Albidovulum sp.]